ncbi:hypothetical protein smi_0979 [Streptococcus mitis B6]|uniref:Gram-positive cocci surface proteins LPxTG domain-containing protein n=2 Tax=Streptococcus mitis TaxID=28037 RepID=D3H8N1_STRM6|nr:YSIRK signal domain/LPXTG anchor domain surface protein [Streptococcus mitis]CBJ22226.1 hypothetical protein smi_0979 [Streptococcus mitis B6]
MFHKGKHDREKQLRFSIRKVSFGAASVAVAALFMFLGNGAVSAAEQSVPSTNGETQAPQPKEPNAQNGTYEGNTVATSPAATVETNTQPSTVENSPSPESAPQKVETLDKKELTDLIKEIDGKFAKGTYATKTEESVNNLRTILDESRTVLSTATTQTELTAAYRKLITATSKLQTKSEKKKEQPLDNTTDKLSEGKKLTSAEKTLESNSIANSGSRDERNGKALDTNNPFRTDSTPSTVTSTDPLATNATNVAIVNGNFNDTSQGAVLPTAKSDPITVKNDISKLTGWKPVNSTTTTVPLIWTANASQYGDAFPGDRGSGIGAVLAVYPGRGAWSGRQKPEFGPIYQDIDVVGGQEVKVTWRGTTVNINSGNNGAKLVVKNPETGAVLGQYARGYAGTPMGEMSVLVNVPKGLTKLRLQFETALDKSTENHSGDNRFNKPSISSDENAGGVVSNVRVASGSYLVSEVVNTTYESTATSATPTTVNTTVTVKVINKGFSTSTNNQYRVELPEGATLVGTTGTSSAQLNGTSLTLGFNNLDPKREQTLTYTFSLPTNKPIEKQLEGTVSYQTSGNLIDNGTKKTGSDTVAQQTVKINMYKADLQAEAAKVATLNQIDYTPEAWAAYQAELAKAQEILNEETNNVEIANRKNQADINAQTLLLQKAQAKLEVDKAKKAKLTALEGTPNATKEEKDAAKQAAQDAATKANQAIDAATDNAGVATAQTDGIAAIEAVTPTVAVKAAAKAEVAKKLAEKLTALEGTPNATKEEKDAAKQAAQDAATKANQAIDAATDNAGVATAQTDGIAAIEAVTPTVAVKAAAKAEVAKKLAEKLTALEGTPNATKEEKDAAKQAAQDAATKANQAIDAATDNAGVATAQTDGIAAIEAVTPTVAVKAAAKAEVAKKLAEKLTALEGTPNATKEEKDAAKQAAQDAATKANQAIDAATDNAGVATAQTDGIAAIEAVTPTVAVKAAAKAEVAKKLAEKLTALEGTPNATKEEKDAAKQAAQDAATKANQAIDAATDNAGVATAQTDGIAAIEAVTPTVAVKAAAKAEVAKKLAEKLTALEGTPNATKEEKDAAKQAAQDAATKANQAIDAATDNAGVATAQTDGIAAIEAVTPTVGTSSTDSAGNGITPQTAEYIGSVNGISEETPAKPAYDGSADEIPDRTPISETTINKDRQLPNTGTANPTVAMVAAAASAVLGLGLVGRRRKEDEEV